VPILRRLLTVVALGVVLSIGGAVAQEGSDVNQKLSALEDREAIRQLLIDYGRTLDARDFAGFAELFASDAVYVGGGPGGEAHGPEAIRNQLEKTFQANPSGVSGPNFHLFFNATIELHGDEATSTSKGAFVIQSADNHPDLLILATYHDTLVREDGRWKFSRREVLGDIPAPVRPATR
jgi:uncharacterized protein (TIGR02246 family)